MRSWLLTGLCASLLVGAAASGQAQQATAQRSDLGIVFRWASGSQLGPEISRGLTDRGLLSTRMDISLLAMVANTVNRVWIMEFDADFRTAAVVGSLGVTGEFGARRGQSRGWYAIAAAGLTAVRWGAGTWEPGYGLYNSVDPEGTITLFPTTSFGIGREFGAFGGRNRLELRVDRHHDAVALIDGFRMSVTRVR